MIFQRIPDFTSLILEHIDMRLHSRVLCAWLNENIQNLFQRRQKLARLLLLFLKNRQTTAPARLCALPLDLLALILVHYNADWRMHQLEKTVLLNTFKQLCQRYYFCNYLTAVKNP